MYVQMCACMCKCVHVCVHVCMYVQMCACVCTCVHGCVRVCMYVQMCACMCKCVHVCANVCMYVQMCACAIHIRCACEYIQVYYIVIPPRHRQTHQIVSLCSIPVYYIYTGILHSDTAKILSQDLPNTSNLGSINQISQIPFDICDTANQIVSLDVFGGRCACEYIQVYYIIYAGILHSDTATDSNRVTM